MSLIELREVRKCFLKDKQVTDVISPTNLTVAPGESCMLIGPSGCGKSTILNLVAGFLQPTMGEVLYKGEVLRGINTRVGYMPQRDGNLPWRTVLQDVMLPLEITGVRRSEAKERAQRLIRLVGLTGFEHHYPRELSGGMRKRAVLARTLVYEPECLLMDEPFAALDAQTKLLMHQELQQVLERTGRRNLLFVTHDLEEAITLADRVVVLSKRPTAIKLVQTVDLPWPRDMHSIRFTKLFGELYQQLWNCLREEIDS